MVLLAYGADFNWNEQMREAAQLLMNRYQIEFVFSMADQSTIERAIRKLERRGAKAAIIVRIFVMEKSFRREIERMVGLDIENKAQKTSVHEVHGGQGFVQHGIVKKHLYPHPHPFTHPNNRRNRSTSAIRSFPA